MYNFLNKFNDRAIFSAARFSWKTLSTIFDRNLRSNKSSKRWKLSTFAPPPSFDTVFPREFFAFPLLVMGFFQKHAFSYTYVNNFLTILLSPNVWKIPTVDAVYSERSNNIRDGFQRSLQLQNQPQNSVQISGDW